MYNRSHESNLPALSVAERLTRMQSAIRHANQALKLNKIVEALVVLEASEREQHLTWTQLHQLIAAKEAELLQTANQADVESLKISHNKVLELEGRVGGGSIQ